MPCPAARPRIAQIREGGGGDESGYHQRGGRIKGFFFNKERTDKALF